MSIRNKQEGNRKVTPAPEMDPMSLSQKELKEAKLRRMNDLNLMIANGWGDTPQWSLPEDWRTRQRK